ncbi:PREDICTED: angiopoietin-related protein 3 [Lepidothrix coronata]|uniref:Angiopoietin-related protein 3 n=1 Tax=Lepidothrix coronata TaxID=321398 RepID=A0A6J0GBD1_9PASS|nr:PREDICTED: angiopoietin-related protein 3 [Lepidothrix coronata]
MKRSINRPNSATQSSHTAKTISGKSLCILNEQRENMNITLVLLFMAPLALSADKDYFSVDSAGSPETKSRFAMLDDVRILANGLLQLGHGLKDFVHKTKGQMNDILQKLNIFDRSFYELSVQTSEIKEEEEQLRQTTARLQINNDEIKNLSQQMNLKIEDLIQNKIQLQEKVWGLEDKVTKLAIIQPLMQETKEISSLKAFVEQQDNDIKQLLKIVEDQHVQLDRQRNQIMELEDKLNHIELQELIENSFTEEQPEPETIPFPVLKATAGRYRSDGAAPDCTALYHSGERFSGVYTIKPNGSEAFDVYCEMKFGTSWTVIQKRVDGSLDFNQTWDAYTKGFGDLNEEFWLGLNKTYSITKQGDYILRIELQDWKGNKRHIEYLFSLGGPDTNYTLQLSRISGSIPNALPEETELQFSTADHDVDTKHDSNCPQNFLGGWWHSECEETNLNGKYVTPRSRARLDRRKGLYWKPKKGRYYFLKSTKIMIHPTDLKSFD